MQRNKTQLRCERAWSQGKEIYTRSNGMMIKLEVVSIPVQRRLGDFAGRLEGEFISPDLLSAAFSSRLVR